MRAEFNDVNSIGVVPISVSLALDAGIAETGIELAIEALDDLARCAAGTPMPNHVLDS